MLTLACQSKQKRCLLNAYALTLALLICQAFSNYIYVDTRHPDGWIKLQNTFEVVIPQKKSVKIFIFLNFE